MKNVMCCNCGKEQFDNFSGAVKKAKKKQIYTETCLQCKALIHVFPDGRLTAETKQGIKTHADLMRRIEADEIGPEDLQAAADFYDRLIAGTAYKDEKIKNEGSEKS